MYIWPYLQCVNPANYSCTFLVNVLLCGRVRTPGPLDNEYEFQAEHHLRKGG